MQEKSAIGTRQTSVHLNGDVTAVDFGHDYKYYAVRNDGTASIYVSTENPDCTVGANGVVCVPAGGGYTHYNGYGGSHKIYLSGNGAVTVIAQDDGSCPFKSAPDANGGSESVKEVSGASSYTVDAVDYPIIGLNLYGKSTQKGTPTPENPVEIRPPYIGKYVNIYVYARDKDDFIWNDYTKAPFSPIGNAELQISENEIYVTGQNYDGVCISKEAIDEYLCRLVSRRFRISFEMKSNTGSTVEFGVPMSNSMTKTLSSDWQSFLLESYFGINKPYSIYFKIKNTDVNDVYIRNIKLNPCVRTDNGKVTSGFPLYGIPVTTGGNHTDNNGQKWVCDKLIYDIYGMGKVIKHTGIIDSYNGETISGAYISTTGSLTTGAKVVYQLETPEEIELSVTEISALMKLQTFDGLNEIEANGYELYVKYCTNKALSGYITPITNGLRKQIDTLNAAILSMGSNV